MLNKCKLLVFIVVLTTSGQSFSQSDQELRKMHEYMQKRLEQIQKSLFSDDDFFSDDFGNILDDMGSGLGNSFGSGFGGGSISYTWKNEAKSKTLVITKPDEKTPVDIVIEKGMINLTAKISKKTANGTFMSQLSNSISVPMECDENAVDIKDKGKTIEVIFPFKKEYIGAKPIRKIIPRTAPAPRPKRKQPNKKPLKPREGDITL